MTDLTTASITEADDYQRAAARTMLDRPDFSISDLGVLLAWDAIGLAGESGEVADLIKKGVFHQRGVDTARVADELGDVLWYVAALASHLGISLSSIMQGNLDKLARRFPDGQGYTAEAANAKADRKAGSQ